MQQEEYTKREKFWTDIVITVVSTGIKTTPDFDLCVFASNCLKKFDEQFNIIKQEKNDSSTSQKNKP